MVSVELSDEFIERVANAVAAQVRHSNEWTALRPREITVMSDVDMIRQMVVNALQTEREPVHRFLFEVRAPGRIAASHKLDDAIRSGELFEKYGITMSDPDERRMR